MKATTYQGALDSLDGLLKELEQGLVPLDELASKVEEGAELLAFCQQRIQETEQRVKQLLASLEFS